MTSWGHWKNPVIYMSRATVLFDDRMELGETRLEEMVSDD